MVLDRPGGELDGAVADQFAVPARMDVSIREGVAGLRAAPTGTVVDALVGYGLRGSLRGTAAVLVRELEDWPAPVLSVDVPSGMDATSGRTSDDAVEPDRTLTLALPKTGLDAAPGEVVLADIGLPALVFRRAGIDNESPFTDGYWIELVSP